MNWDECEFVERVEGRCGGRPTIVGTRVWPEIILNCLEDGMDGEDIWEQYTSLTPTQVRGVIAFIQGHRSVA